MAFEGLDQPSVDQVSQAQGSVKTLTSDTLSLGTGSV